LRKQHWRPRQAKPHPTVSSNPRAATPENELLILHGIAAMFHEPTHLAIRHGAANFQMLSSVAELPQQLPSGSYDAGHFGDDASREARKPLCEYAREESCRLIMTTLTRRHKPHLDDVGARSSDGNMVPYCRIPGFCTSRSRRSRYVRNPLCISTSKGLCKCSAEEVEFVKQGSVCDKIFWTV